MHNPEYLNNTGIAQMVAQYDIRLLAISPHVGNYARQVLEAQGVKVRAAGGPAGALRSPVAACGGGGEVVNGCRCGAAACADCLRRS